MRSYPGKSLEAAAEISRIGISMEIPKQASIQVKPSLYRRTVHMADL
jgi:hypothetical protein